MHLKINRQTFLDEITKANKIVDSKSINPELLGVLINVETDKIVILSTNGLMNWKSIIVKNDQNQLLVQEPGKILVKGRYLIDLLRKMEDFVVDLKVVETNELIITGKSLKFNLQLLDSNNFPLIGFYERGNVVDLNPQEFRKAVLQVIISVDEANKKMLLTGMNLKGRQGQNNLEVYTTDSFRISKRIISLEKPLDFDLDINIPLKTLNEVVRLLDGASNLKIIVVEGYLTFVVDNHSFLQTSLIEGKFPNVDRAFPKEFATKVVLNRNKIIRSINRANIGNEENLIQTVTLNINNEVIKLSSQSIDIGNYDEDFTDFEFNGVEQSISFNTKFLLDALRSFESDQVELNLTNSSKPLEIKELNDESLKQLILPLNIN